MPVKDLKKAYLRVSVESESQFRAACSFPACDLIYIDSGYFKPEIWKESALIAHKGTGGMGKLLALRLPQVWRDRAEKYLNAHLQLLKEAGFDAFLAGNPEEIFWLLENGVPGDKIIADHSIYRFNRLTDGVLDELTGEPEITRTCSLELNFRELKALSMTKDLSVREELVVYGRANLMVTAQCIRKTGIGCDRRMSVMWIKDRTGAMMPVRNCCTYCCNTVYNSVPTVIYDLKEEVEAISPDSVRYEFTVEEPEKMKEILSGTVPANFTRGHFRRGVI